MPYHVAEEIAWVQTGNATAASGEVYSSWGVYLDPDDTWVSAECYCCNYEALDDGPV